MKKLMMSSCCMLMSFTVFCQCEKAIKKTNLETGMMLFGTFDKNAAQVYVARVSAVTATGFTCVYMQSNSTYWFKEVTLNKEGADFAKATVANNKGGKYSAGSKFEFLTFAAAPDACNLNSKNDYKNENCMCTFNDGKTFLGSVSRVNGQYEITFLHSSSKYYFDDNWKIKKVTGGAYAPGQKVKVVYAQEVSF